MRIDKGPCLIFWGSNPPHNESQKASVNEKVCVGQRVYNCLLFNEKTMKRKLCILIWTLLNLLFVSKVNAVLPNEDILTLGLADKHTHINGEFSLKESDPLRKYFVDVNALIRVDDRSIKIKTKDQFSAQIRVEVDKGILHFCKTNKYVYNHRFNKNLPEGENFSPINLVSWNIYGLSMDTKDITLSIYKQNTNELLEQKKYVLKGDTVGKEFYALLEYTDINGNIQRCSEGTTVTRDSVVFDAPMRVVVTNDWDDPCQVISFGFCYGIMGNTIPPINEGETLIPYYIEVMKNIRNRLITLTNIKYLFKEREILAPPITITIR